MAEVYFDLETPEDAGVPQWLFFVDDGGTTLAASYEAGGVVYAARATASNVKVDAMTKVPAIDISAGVESGTGREYRSVADHWHVWAEATGTHWIVGALVGTEGDTGIGVVRLDTSFDNKDGADEVAVHEVYFVDPKTGDLKYVDTNDLFAVEWTDGADTRIAIVVKSGKDSAAILIVKDSAPGVVADRLAFRGAADGGPRLENGGSATYDPSRTWPWSFLAPHSLGASEAQPINQVSADLNLRSGSEAATDTPVEVLPATDGATEYLHAMPMEVELGDGNRAMVVRREEKDTGTDDAGDILLYVLDPDYVVIGSPVEIVSDIGNKPHIVRHPSDDSGMSVIVVWEQNTPNDHGTTDIACYAQAITITVEVEDVDAPFTFEEYLRELEASLKRLERDGAGKSAIEAAQTVHDSHALLNRLQAERELEELLPELPHVKSIAEKSHRLQEQLRYADPLGVGDYIRINPKTWVRNLPRNVHAYTPRYVPREPGTLVRSARRLNVRKF